MKMRGCLSLQPPVRTLSLGLMNDHFRIIDSYVHGGRIGVLIELELQTDFGARTPAVQTLMKDLAMHIGASAPESIDELMEQPFVKEPARTIGDLLAVCSKHIQEPIAVARFVRWETGQNLHPSDLPPKGPAVAVRLRSAG